MNQSAIAGLRDGLFVALGFWRQMEIIKIPEFGNSRNALDFPIIDAFTTAA
jgi:hypothetical protein